MRTLLTLLLSAITLSACESKPTVVAPGLEVLLEYKAVLDGELIDTSPDAGPVVFVVGEGVMKEAVEKELIGMKVGDRKKVTIPNAYGVHDPSQRGLLPHSKYTKDAQVGDWVPRINQSPAIVLEVREDSLVIDLNHTLAGKTLDFDLHVVEVRQPTAKDDEGNDIEIEIGPDQDTQVNVQG